MSASYDEPLGRKLTASDSLRNRERAQKDNDLASSDYDFYDAMESQESSDEETVYEIEEVDTPVVAPAVFVNPNSRASAPSTPTIPTESVAPTIAPPLHMVEAPAVVPQEAERPKYPTLEEGTSSLMVNSSDITTSGERSPEKPTVEESTTRNSGGLFSWFGSLFRSSTPQPKESDAVPPSVSSLPSKDSSTASAIGTNMTTTAQSNPALGNQKSSPPLPSSNTQPEQQLHGPKQQIEAPQQQQPQNHYYFFFGPNSDATALPPQVRMIVDSALTQSTTAPSVLKVSDLPVVGVPIAVPSSKPLVTSSSISAVSGSSQVACVDPAIPPPPPAPTSVPSAPPLNLGPTPPPPPPLPQWNSSDDEAAPSTASPSSGRIDLPNSYASGAPSEHPASPPPPAIAPAGSAHVVSAAERKAHQNAAREAERAKKARDAWVSKMTELVMACERLRPQHKQEAIQHWTEWYNTNIPHAVLLTDYYGYLLKALPKQFDFIKRALVFWEGSLFGELPNELKIQEADTNTMRSKRCNAICFAEEKWFRKLQANEATEEAIQAERTSFLTASFSFCENLVQTSKDQQKHQDLQNQLGSVLGKILQKVESETAPLEYDE